MALNITRAVKTDLRLRMAISGQSGGGKTFTSLTIGTRLAELAGGGVCVLDTERGSALRFADRFHFDHAPFDAPYSPTHYLEAVQELDAAGYAVIIIDSLSHAWEDDGGILEIHARLTAANPRHNGFEAWRDAKPQQRKFVDALFRSRAHLICTIRDKQAWEVTRDEKGKAGVEKLGLKPVQGDDLEYEFDIWGDMDRANDLLISKSRMVALAERKAVHRPTRALADEIYAWLTDGGAPATAPKASPTAAAASPPTPPATPPSSPASNAAGSAFPATLPDDDVDPPLTALEFVAACKALGYDTVAIAGILGATEGASPKQALARWFDANGRSWDLALKVITNHHAITHEDDAAQPPLLDLAPDREPAHAARGSH